MLGVFVKDKCGYIDQTGKIVIKPQFDACWSFSEGLASVEVNGKLGVIDETGTIVIHPQFDWYPLFFHEGLATITLRKRDANGELESEKQAYVSENGELIMLPSDVSSAGDFYEGLAVVKSKGLKGYIDKKMGFIIPPKFRSAHRFHDGLASVCEPDWICYYINKRGQKVIDVNGSDFVNGLAFIEENGKYGFIDVSGRRVISPQFENVGFFYGGFAKVEVGGKWGYINTNGTIVIAPKFDSADDFSSDGIAAVLLNDKWGFINTSGEIVVRPQFDFAEWCDNGVGMVETSKKKGYVDKLGEYVWLPSR